MASFPVLKSGQIAQYPLRRSTIQLVDKLAFLDSREQRSAITRQLNEWTIQLGLIDEQELNALEIFVRQQQGETGHFVFTDPADGTQYDNCSIAIQAIDAHLAGPGRIVTSLVIRENPD